ncbi:MAG TPA: fibronectin type III domain-containing protein, partial [Armatimonadota bacterium]|nr:fibronectin type III domain-containing protein [Armatimonadota bacterium]
FGRSGDLVPTFSISGTITLNGSGLAGVTVSAGGSSATTGVNGTYTIPGVAAGTYAVTPSRSGHLFTPTSQNVTVTSANVSGINFTAAVDNTAFSISGRVTSGASGVGGVTVSAGGSSALTGADGSYTIGGLTSGSYTVVPSRTGYTFTPVSRAVTLGPSATGVDFTGSGVPAAPSNLTATVQPGSDLPIQLSWTDNAGNETGFKVEVRTAATSYVEIGGPAIPANTTQILVTGAARNTQYFFRVRAYNGVGNSGYSNEAPVTTPPFPPKAPKQLTAKALSSTSIALKWKDKSTDETAFKIEAAPVGGAFQQIGTVGANTTTATVTSLKPNTKYQFRVRATNAGGDSGYSNTAKKKTKAQ